MLVCIVAASHRGPLRFAPLRLSNSLLQQGAHSGRDDPAVRRHDRILAAARALHDRRDARRGADASCASRGDAGLRQQLAGHAPRDVRAPVPQRVSPGLEVERARRAREPRALSEPRASPTTGTSDSRRPPTVDGTPVVVDYPGAPDSTVAHFRLPRAARAARFGSRHVRVGRAAVDGAAPAGAARPHVRLRAVVSEGRRLRSRRLGAESARPGGRAVRRVRDVRRHDDRARRSGARVDRRSGRAAIRDGRACREPVRRGSATTRTASCRRTLAGDRAGGISRRAVRRRERASFRVERVAGLSVRGRHRTFDRCRRSALSDVGHRVGARAVQAGRRHDVGRRPRARAHDRSRSSGSSRSRDRTRIRRSRTCIGSTGAAPSSR